MGHNPHLPLPPPSFPVHQMGKKGPEATPCQGDGSRAGAMCAALASNVRTQHLVGSQKNFFGHEIKA